MENVLSTGKGFTLVVMLHLQQTIRVHGLFDTAEEAEEYAQHAQIKLPDDSYARIASLSYQVVPFVLQG